MIKIIGSYSKMTWYAGLIGKTFEVAEVDSHGAVRIKNENEINSCWVYQNDYQVIGGIL